jgi:SAM-dependent methyltransferase
VPDHADWFADNRANWDDRAAVHEAAGYGIAELAADPQALSPVVARDIERIGHLTGLDVCHLQCHLGTDTVSLARLGARRVVGLDFSAEAVRRARTVAARCGAEVEFVVANVYDARSAIAGDLDVVYTSIGALPWLPDVAGWARVVASLLRPGGRVFLREDHPFRATIADDVSDGLRVAYPYFEQDEPLTWDEAHTYVSVPEGAPVISHTIQHEWNHGIGEVVTALIRAGLVIDELAEFDHMAWTPWPSAMVESERGAMLAEHPERLPLEYAVRAHRPTAS